MKPGDAFLRALADAEAKKLEARLQALANLPPVRALMGLEPERDASFYRWRERGLT